jgi:predicted pyridoxine 5'-phosphate oxidase superfamily flavin-nucleotide-binding protein
MTGFASAGPGTGPASWFHEGELAVQSKAGVLEDAARLSGMLAPARLSGGIARFLADRRFAAITARDAEGTLWTSPLVGPPGFLRVAAPAVLEVRARPVEGDPLCHLPTPQPVGLIVIEYGLRRRLRINGTLVHTGPAGLRIDVAEAYGNCPQYIRPRSLHQHPEAAHSPSPVRRGLTLTEEDIALIGRSDSFLIGTVHPRRGADASHRGGAPGFVRVVEGTLRWPDYPGNNMFNTLGNLEADSTAALLFPDFATGRSLHLSGRATVRWSTPGGPDDDGQTGRQVQFTPRRVIAGTHLPLRDDPAPLAPARRRRVEEP